MCVVRILLGGGGGGDKVVGRAKSKNKPLSTLFNRRILFNDSVMPNEKRGGSSKLVECAREVDCGKVGVVSYTV